jgi:hypothetical protein
MYQFAESSGLFLWFQIQVLTLLTGAFTVSLSLLMVDMLGCMSMDVVPSCQTALGDIYRVFEPRLSLTGWAICCRRVLWNCPTRSWFVSSHWSLPPTGQAEIKFFDGSPFSSLPVPPRWSLMFLISPGGSCVTPSPLHWSLTQHSIPPLTNWQLSIPPCPH